MNANQSLGTLANDPRSRSTRLALGFAPQTLRRLFTGIVPVAHEALALKLPLAANQMTTVLGGLLLVLLALPAVVQAQFNCTTNSNNTITITGYTGSSGAVSIPSIIDGMPVTSIGYSAFEDCTRLTSVTIPNSVTNIANGAFDTCSSLAAITVDATNSVYSSVDGVLFNKRQTTIIRCPEGKVSSYTIPNSVTNIGSEAFYYCTRLTSVTIPNSVTSIEAGAFFCCTNLTSVTIPNSVTSIEGGAFYGCSCLTSVTIPNSVTSIASVAFDGCTSLSSVTIPSSVTSIGAEAFLLCSSLTSVTIPNSITNIASGAFEYCTRLTGVYFQGHAPFVGQDVFNGADNSTIYYLAGTTGWGPTFGGRPTMLWTPQANPQVQTSDASFGVRTNRFGFNITGSSNLVVVVEACTDLANPTWLALQTNTLTGASSYFSDPEWTNYLARFYRLRSP